MLAGAAGADQPAASSSAHEAFLRAEIKAARSRAFYLVLDPVAETLQLRLKHVDLLTVPVRARLGGPRGGGTALWPAVACSLTTSVSEPERPRLTPPRRAAGDTATAPALSVEAIQAARDRFMNGLPACYRLAFKPDLVVEIVGEAPQPGAGDRWRRAGRRFASAWRGLGERLLRRSPYAVLELRMSAPDARRLYLARVPGMLLLIAPPVGAP